MRPDVVYAEAVPADTVAHSYPYRQSMAPLPGPDEAGARQFLTRHNWPVGLQELFLKGCVHLPIRFIIVDDSGSMTANDGRRLLPSGNKLK